MFRTLILFALSVATAFGQSAIHDLEIIPDAAGVAGEFRFVETTGWTTGAGVNYVGLKTPASITANVVWTLPSVDGAAGECLKTDGAKVLSWTACSGGGGGFYQTMRDEGVDETQRGKLNFIGSFVLTDDVAGDETEVTLLTSPAAAATLVGALRSIATTLPLTGGGDFSANRTFACATCVTTDTAQTITAVKTFEDKIEIKNPSAAAKFSIQWSTINSELQFKDTAGAEMFTLQAGLNRVEFHDTLVPSAAQDIGMAGIPFGNIFILNDVDSDDVIANNYTVKVDALPDAAGGANIGSEALPFDGWFQDLDVDNPAVFDSTISVAAAATLTGGLATGSSSNSTLYIGTGNFYVRDTGGTSASISCTGVTDGWMAITNDNDLILCNGSGTRFKVALTSF